MVLMRRDGAVLASIGGHGVPELRPDNKQTNWSAHTEKLLRQLVRKALADRAFTDASFEEGASQYQVRVTPQGPDRALCLIRAAAATRRDGSAVTDVRPRPELDRRGFLRRFRESLSIATLQEKSIAVAVVYLEGLLDITHVMTSKVSDQIVSTALLRLATQSLDPDWYVGQLGETTLAVVVESGDRDAVEQCIAALCASLREPVLVGETQFRVTPHAGVALLGSDASSPSALLDHARSAAGEARRASNDRVVFFSDTLQLRSLARLDIARELREAIGNRAIGLRYAGRHDLRSGALVSRLAYVRWVHPLRGEIRPSEFVRVAETTGLGVTLSRTALACLAADFRAHSGRWPAQVRVSFGALRSHVLHQDFVEDIDRFLQEAALPAELLELRIAEKAFIARDQSDLRPLQRRGVQFVVDEVARGMASLPLLARAGLWGLQLDRAWVKALREDQIARKVCKAAIGIAAALELKAIATGVDDDGVRQSLLGNGM